VNITRVTFRLAESVRLAAEHAADKAVCGALAGLGLRGR